MKSINQFLHQTIINGSKKTTLILALLLIGVTSFSFANGTNDIIGVNGTDSVKSTDIANPANGSSGAYPIRTQVSTSFKQDFKNAEIISSEVSSNFTKLTFRMNDMVLFAFYADNGKLIAIVRNILSSQLPINLMMDLKKKYHDYWITELFELNGKGQNCYYISLENADAKLVLRSNDDNAWEVYQHTEKK